MKPKEIFGLAVRLLGLVFLYLGFKDLPILMDVSSLMVEEKRDIIAAILPVVFNLAVAFWLMRGSLLIRWAYPEKLKLLEHPRPTTEQTGTSHPAPAQELKDLDSAEKKLAALLAKPKEDRAA
jgi:hypothetical protein